MCLSDVTPIQQSMKVFIYLFIKHLFDGKLVYAAKGTKRTDTISATIHVPDIVTVQSTSGRRQTETDGDTRHNPVLFVQRQKKAETIGSV